MSDLKLRELINQYGSPNSRGGSSYWTPELRGLWDEMLKAEGTDQVSGGKRRPIDAAEEQSFLALEPANMSKEGRRLYNELKAKLAELRHIDQPPPPGGDAKPFTAGNARKPAFLNAAGWAVPKADIAGQPDNANAEEGLYRLALLISQSGDGRVATLDGLSTAEKQTLAENAIAMAERSLGAGAGRLDGLSEIETKQLRSSAFTVLYQIAKSVPNDAARLKLRLFTALQSLADREPNKLLGLHMVRVMDRDDFRAGLTAAQKADVDALFDEKIPQKFDVGNILSPDGYIQWSHISGQGEGFFRSFVNNLGKKSVDGVQFRKVREDFRGAEFEITFPQPKGENGRIKGIRVNVREFNNDEFDDVGTGRGFSYGGHSQIGLNQENSLARAVARGLRTDKPQLALIDCCAGLDNLDDDLEKLGNLEVLTTFGSSFFWKGRLHDENGDFDGVTKSEGLESLIAVFSSLVKEEGYDKMRGRVETAITNWSHERNPNVAFPTIKDYREVRWAHLDGDNDGRMDANDVLYQFGLKQARTDGNNEFGLIRDVEYDEVDGDGLKNAILDLNVSTHYNERMEGNDAVVHKFLGGGYFDGTDSSELVRFKPGRNHDGAAGTVVEFNHGLAHTSREALSALTQYSSVMFLADSGKVQGLSEVDRKLMALTFATFRLTFDHGSRTDDQRIWRQLLVAMRLPADLPYGPLQTLVDDEEHNYSGSMEIVNKFKESLSPEQLRALAVRDVGRPGGGPPVQPIA